MLSRQATEEANEIVEVNEDDEDDVFRIGKGEADVGDLDED